MDFKQYLPIVFIALGAGIFATAILLEIRRNKALQALSVRLHMNYVKRPGPYLLGEHAFLNLFNQGRAQEASNLIERSESGLYTACFDYSYVTGSGKNNTTCRQSVVTISNPNVRIPHFLLEPENFLHRIADKFTDKDIDFEAYPEFSNMFQLKGHDEAEIHRLFSKEVVRHLEGCKGLSIESYENRIIFYKNNRRCSIKQIEAFIRDALKTYGILIRKSSD